MLIWPTVTELRAVECCHSGLAPPLAGRAGRLGDGGWALASVDVRAAAYIGGGRVGSVMSMLASEVHMGISRRGPGPSVWTLALTGIADSDDADSGDIGRDLGEIIDCVQRLLQKFRNEQVHWHATARQLELQV